MTNETDDPRTNDQRPSKTQRKKAMHELQSLGERLVELKEDRLAAIELPEELREAVREARRVRSHEGRRRQMQYIGKLMRGIDPEPIREQFAAWDGQSRAHIALEHEITAWRERLMEDEDTV
jgi:ribosome-associated protein